MPWWRWALAVVLVISAALVISATLSLARHGMPLDASGRRAMAWAMRSMALLQVAVCGMVVVTAPAAIPALVACALWLAVLAERTSATPPGQRVRAGLARILDRGARRR